ncbi:ATP-binding protein [Frateuria aurantia]|uniref:histidine kinase n=1 Tax=Frateuria aurantia (strain ATCC 33424 / DSM 6220 / KCTC 2777 / LMG 1558 / NBRC 3245 / NCIMB 13370) TaxID=767434 RepID=H8KYY0_FRAAD|nr:ATP-binding protein [Frateuria aurantia]AFC87010.1 signal transduction histidine kinase [Frateuria aurantia DSM 6220]
MSLRRKLLWLALCTLVLPVTGWLYLRQMQGLLREGQAQALTAAARAVARGMLLDDSPLPTAERGWYLQTSLNPITVDGYADDWAPLTPWQQHPPGGDGQVLLAANGTQAYLFVSMPVSSRVRADSDDPRALQADHLVLALSDGTRWRRYLLASAAPGTVQAQGLDPPVEGLPETFSGQWQEDGTHWQVELALPLTTLLNGLGIGLHRGHGPGDPARADERPVFRLSPAISSELAELAPSGTRARVLSADGWVLGETGALRSARAEPGWLATLIYEVLLAGTIEPAELWMQDAPRLPLPAAIAQGRASVRWHYGETRGSTVLSVAVPILRGGKLQSVLLIEQVSSAMPLMANKALLELLLSSLAAMLLAGGILLVFATRLSWRLRRLSHAIRRVELNDGRYAGSLSLGASALTASEDEIGELARRFEALFGMIDGYTSYLRTLASKLSHELNTPLAIVKSSLDNLELVLPSPLPPGGEAYLSRARDGLARLSHLVRAMSESSRVEQAIASTDLEDIELGALVGGCVEAYRGLVGPRQLECQLPPVPVFLHGAPELIAQALDKLFDNALSFSPESGWIRLSLRRYEDEILLEVANRGPLLPEGLGVQLFGSLVSQRNNAAPGEAPHLGLGLYVVKLVCEFHRGRATARNLADGSGVAFTMHLRSLPRTRLAGSDSGH